MAIDPKEKLKKRPKSSGDNLTSPEVQISQLSTMIVLLTCETLLVWTHKIALFSLLLSQAFPLGFLPALSIISNR